MSTESQVTRPRSPAFAEVSIRMSEADALREQLARLRTDLVDLAFSLERRARFDAADVALTVSARIGELCEQNAPAEIEAGAESGRKSLPPGETA